MLLDANTKVNVVHALHTADVCIDFSSPAGVEKLLTKIKGTKVALVTGTTGLSDSQFQKLKKDKI